MLVIVDRWLSLKGQCCEKNRGDENERAGRHGGILHNKGADLRPVILPQSAPGNVLGFEGVIPACCLSSIVFNLDEFDSDVV